MLLCAKLTWHVIIGEQKIAILCQDLIEVILYKKIFIFKSHVKWHVFKEQNVILPSA
jgi:hypothetical protein